MSRRLLIKIVASKSDADKFVDEHHLRLDDERTRITAHMSLAAPRRSFRIARRRSRPTRLVLRVDVPMWCGRRPSPAISRFFEAGNTESLNEASRPRE